MNTQQIENQILSLEEKMKNYDKLGNKIQEFETSIDKMKQQYDYIQKDLKASYISLMKNHEKMVKSNLSNQNNINGVTIDYETFSQIVYYLNIAKEYNIVTNDFIKNLMNIAKNPNGSKKEQVKKEEHKKTKENIINKIDEDIKNAYNSIKEKSQDKSYDAPKIIPIEINNLDLNDLNSLGEVLMKLYNGFNTK